MIYIPAGRAFLSRQALLQLIQTDEINRIRPDEQPYQYDIYDIIDAPTGNYISEVRRVREWFLSPQVNERLNKNGNNACIEYLQKLNNDILKGSYIADKYNDYIRMQGSKDVKISYASSGQQEVIWLLNLLYAFAVEKRKCVIIIEEPETHLHPEAQYMLAKCIAAFSNYTKSEVIVSTHSPYVLSSFNNLIYAGKCRQSSVEHNKLNSIIHSESWLDPDTFSAYVLEQGEIRSIKDDDLAMIDIADLDAIASSQDTEYEQMSSLNSEVQLCATS
jgi:AAA15 family ATPase/GTPase